MKVPGKNASSGSVSRLIVGGGFTTPPGWPWVLVRRVRKKPDRGPEGRTKTQCHTGPVVNRGPYDGNGPIQMLGRKAGGT